MDHTIRMCKAIPVNVADLIEMGFLWGKILPHILLQGFQWHVQSLWEMLPDLLFFLLTGKNFICFAPCIGTHHLGQVIGSNMKFQEWCPFVLIVSTFVKMWLRNYFVNRNILSPTNGICTIDVQSFHPKWCLEETDFL